MTVLPAPGLVPGRLDRLDRLVQRRSARIVLLLLGAASVVAATTVVARTPSLGLPVAVGLALALGGSIVALSLRDAAAVLTLVMALVLLLPEPLVLVGPLRSVGNPAMLVAIAGLGAWCAARMLGNVVPRENHPLRWVILAVALSNGAAFASGLMRPLTDMELSGLSRGIFPVVAWLGIVLLACDAITDRARLDALLYRVLMLAGIAALIGVLEFSSHGFDYQSLMRLPGLTSNVDIVNDVRSSFQRVDGAAAHPIEYAVALAALVPIGLHFVRFAPTSGRRQAAGFVTVLLMAVLPMTVSRSAILAVVIGIAYYYREWDRRARVNAMVLGVFGLVLFRIAVPGLLGTLRSLILIGKEDPSINGRTQDYARIPGLLHDHLLVGRGLGTFQPLQYFFLDNQFLGSLLEGGLIALGSLLALFVVSVSLARGARKRASDACTRSLGQALAGSLAALGISCLTFDELSFKQTGFLVFLLAGCAGALWSMARHQEDVAAGSLVEQTGSRPVAAP